MFLLSILEAEKYFTSDDARQCNPTEYAAANGARFNKTNGKCWWWLRSPGGLQDYAAPVSNGGLVGYYGRSVSPDCGCVRPAMWIDLAS